MQTITLISTLHEEKGNCNAEELCKIIEKLSPDVIFLEALESTYSEYDNLRFSEFGIYHNKLEIKTLQLYSQNASFDYAAILDNELSDAFNNKYSIISKNHETKSLVDHFNDSVQSRGFEFLNSIESTNLQDEMRKIESLYLNNSEIEIDFNKSIDIYENTMIANIYSYCKNNHFNTAIFLCGVAHRKSIIEKIENLQTTKEIKLNWKFYEDQT
jgi:hypothetical protein